MGTSIILVRIISIHRKNSKMGEVERNLAIYAFIESEMVPKGLKMALRVR